jgi:hypothetical protein
MTSEPIFMKRIHRAAATAALLSAAAGAQALDLSYTYIDFGSLTVDSSASGTQVPTPGQTVAVRGDDGDGLFVGGSLAIGRRFYAGGTFSSAVVDVSGTVTSPLASANVTGNFDLVQTRAFFGYIRPLGDNLDLTFEASYDNAEYDFGSFAGEQFDIDDSGVGFSVGLRWNPTRPLEVYGSVRSSAVGEANLTTRTFDTGTEVTAGIRWYFFQDLGLGFDLRSGDYDSFTVSMRFGFGELRAGAN